MSTVWPCFHRFDLGQRRGRARPQAELRIHAQHLDPPAIPRRERRRRARCHDRMTRLSHHRDFLRLARRRRGCRNTQPELRPASIGAAELHRENLRQTPHHLHQRCLRRRALILLGFKIRLCAIGAAARCRRRITQGTRLRRRHFDSRDRECRIGREEIDQLIHQRQAQCHGRRHRRRVMDESRACPARIPARP